MNLIAPASESVKGMVNCVLRSAPKVSKQTSKRPKVGP